MGVTLLRIHPQFPIDIFVQIIYAANGKRICRGRPACRPVDFGPQGQNPQHLSLPGYGGTARRPFPTNVSLKFATSDIGPPQSVSREYKKSPGSEEPGDSYALKSRASAARPHEFYSSNDQQNLRQLVSGDSPLSRTRSAGSLLRSLPAATSG